jgi:hypothetical protein
MHDYVLVNADLSLEVQPGVLTHEYLHARSPGAIDDAVPFELGSQTLKPLLLTVPDFGDERCGAVGRRDLDNREHLPLEVERDEVWPAPLVIDRILWADEDMWPPRNVLHHEGFERPSSPTFPAGDHHNRCGERFG